MFIIYSKLIIFTCRSRSSHMFITMIITLYILYILLTGHGINIIIIKINDVEFLENFRPGKISTT